LQKGPGAEQLDTIHFPVTRLSRSIDEDAGAFMDTSAILKNIDLLVTSDSAVAHLAGALGVPVWLALPFAPDWRWMRQREDSPWYPTIRLFRQSRPGDWEGVFHRLVEALAARRPHAGVPTRREDYCQAMQWIAEGRCDDARAILEQMRGEHPDAPDIHHNLGVAMAKLGRLDDAIACFREAVRLRPDSTDAQGNLGLAYLQSNKPADAVACFRAHLAARPDSAETHNNLGVALSKLNQLTDAVIHFSEAIRLKPDYLDALNNLGNAYRGQDRFDDALATYREALKHHPQAAEVHNNLGITFASLLSPDEAVASFREALRLKPDFPEAYNNLGVTLADAHRLDEAVEAFDGALRLKPNHPETHRNRALAWLLQGDYERGWPEYEFRWKCEGVPTRPYPRPCWQGEPIAGKTIFLHCEQGLGDSLQFVRYVPLVKAKGAQVLFECHPSLVPLLSRCEGIDQLIPGGKPVPAFDFHCSLMSLPTIFKTTLATIPAKVPYLTPDPARVEYWRQAMDAVAGFKVAIGWQGSPKYGGDRSRSLPLRHFARLAEIEAVRLISVQKGFGTEQLAALGTSGAPRFPVLDLDRQLDQDGAFVDSAAVLVNVDLVVTSDTALAHLAGGLGVPTWLAVCWPCDWRWLRERTDCPWYPTMRLFRQQRWGDWDGVFSEIADALRLLLDRRKPQTETAAPVSVGELIDKLTILAIKKERIKDETRLANVQTEWAALEEVRARSVPEAPLLRELTAELKTINEALWEIEDEIRDCERAKDFGQRFIDLARSVYHQNDRRAAVKRRINEALGSRLVEEKSYAKYD
jgi:tetratricopeptide (TPR) repeat protein